MRATQRIKWGAFGEKHRAYIRAALRARMAVAEGAIRAGKTIDNLIIAAAYLETCPDTYHLATGSTLGNAKLNLGVSNGYGLEALFRGRCRWGKYRDNEALFINTQTGEKIVIFCGGRNADSYKKILGNSYGLWIATEINEHYDSDDSRTSFIKVAMGRQAAAIQPLTLWDLNPCHPQHSIYKDYIDRYKTDMPPGSYIWEHFTIADNANITPERLELIKSQYDPRSVWYRRDILGERAVAEGLIYRYFADDPTRYISAPQLHGGEIISVGLDFGGNKSKTVLIASAISRDFRRVAVLGERGLPITEQIDSERIKRETVDFCRDIQRRYGRISFLFGDNASTTLLFDVQAALREERDLAHIRADGSIKDRILNRVQAIDAMLTAGRLTICPDARGLINALSNLKWDEEKEDTVEDKNIDNINDYFDGFCYSWTMWIDALALKGG